MKWLVVIVSLFCDVSSTGSLFFPGPLLRSFDNRIIGGRRVSASELPYQAAIKMRGENRAFCGGSIIQQNWILTAAHCMKGEKAANLNVVVGTSDLRNPRVVVDVEKIIMHRGFGSIIMQNDLALIKTKQPVIVKGTSAVTLPTKNQDFVGKKAIVSGFGTTKEGGSASLTLMTTTLDVLSDSVCRMAYLLGYRSQSMMCAGHLRGGQDSCQGDSGGPLVVKNGRVSLLAGVVSFGRGCGRTLVPGVYVRVSNFIDWIQDEIRKN